jgi:hypothetical protein
VIYPTATLAVHIAMMQRYHPSLAAEPLRQALGQADAPHQQAAAEPAY